MSESIPAASSSSPDVETIIVQLEDSIKETPESIPAASSSSRDVDSIKETLARSESILAAQTILKNIRGAITARFERKVKYPIPFDRFFEHFNILQVITGFGALIGEMAVLQRERFISEDLMKKQMTIIGSAVFSFTIAYPLQDSIPEIAVVALLCGLCLGLASLYTATIYVIDPSEQIRPLICATIIITYGLMFILAVYKILKEDVREKQSQRNFDPSEQ